MITMTLQEVAHILQIPMPSTTISFCGLSKDTRQAQDKTLYIAIIGEMHDGHHFIAAAKKNGAVAALVSHRVDVDIPQLLVPDTIAALGKLAAYWRSQFQIPLIGGTGSNGKTTFKNMVASILTAACQGDSTKVIATEGNYNNNIGLPMTLSQITHQHRYGVIEMGMNHAGEIAYLTQLVKPRVAVITNAAESHLEGVKNVEGVARAKGEIFEGLEDNGTAVLNKDDAFYDYWLSITKNYQHLTFGLQNFADVTTSHITTEGFYQTFDIKVPTGHIHVKLPLLGQHNVMNALAATAATFAIGIDLESIRIGLENVTPAKGRMNHHFLANGAHIIDDTYNANPFSTEAAIKTLATFTHKKILVLGDMRELGNKTLKLHAETGARARLAGIDCLFTLGELTAETTASFGPNALHFNDRNHLLAALKPLVQNNTTILIKGSRSMKMEQIVHEIVPVEIDKGV